MPRPKSEEAGTRIHLRVTKQQYARIQKLAAAGGYSISETLRRAIDTYLRFVDSKHL
jgi:hypothetical protein